MAEENPSATKRRLQGTSRSYLIDRLKRENHVDLAAAVESGALTPFAAAAGLGWVKRRATVATVTHQARKRQVRFQAITDGDLSAGQKMELIYGPGASGSLFRDRGQLESAWAACRDELLERSTAGRRPAIWWELVADSLGLAWPGYFNEQSYLFDHNVLGEEELAEVVAFWRAEFERTYDPDFSYAAAPGEILHGNAARKSHLDWADVPHSLRRRWSAARRRRERTRERHLVASTEEVAAK
jgi:hypothetical protein